MIYREYGTTGIKVSAIGFGGMRFENHEDLEVGAALLQSAYDAGINYFDTAPLYGKSEDIFGVALKEMKKTRDEKPFYVSTKSNGTKPEDVRRDLENSLRRMNLDYVDFFHVWYVSSMDDFYTRRNNGVLREFERLKEEGLVRHITASTHMPGAEVREFVQQYPFDGILIGYSAMNFAYRDAGLDAIAEKNMGLAVMNPLGGGIIPQNPDRFDFLRSNDEETVVDAGLRFIISDPRITLALVGFGNESHLTDAINAVRTFEPLSKERINIIRDSLSESFNELCTGCQYCDNCPEEIPIPRLMDAYNHLLLANDINDFKARLTLHWAIPLAMDYAAICTECGQCEDICTQHLPIIERIKVVRAKQLRLGG